MQSIIPNRVVHTALGLAFAALTVSACSSDEAVEGVPPVLLGLSASEIQVGHSLDFVGQNFLDPNDGETRMRFDGVFEGETSNYDVNAMVIRTSRETPNQVTWPFFGTYQVPFVPDGDELGVFRGSITPINMLQDGTEIAGEPLNVVLTVKPSILLYTFEPVETEFPCDKPAQQLIAGYAYQMVAATLDFPASSLSITITGEPGAPTEGRTINVPMGGSISNGSMAVLGDNRQVVFAEIPPELTSYVASVRLTANGQNGETLSVSYPVPIYRAVALVPNGKPKLAQIEQAKPVSGCMAGGINGNNVRYEETQSESRTRQVQYRWDTNWSAEKSTQVSKTRDWRNGTNTSLNIGSAKDWGINDSEHTNNSLGGGTSFGAGPLANVNVHGERSWGRTDGGHSGQSRNVSFVASSDRQDGLQINLGTTISASEGGSQGISEFYDISSTKSITRAVTADIIPGMFGQWQRQVTRWIHPAAVVEFDLCGNAHVIADVEISDYQWAVSMAMGVDCANIDSPFDEPVCYSGC